MRTSGTLAVLASLLLRLPVLAGGGPGPERPVISPSLVHVAPGASQPFRVEVAGRPAPDPEWSVNGVPGGNADLGRISPAGVYTAPALAPVPHEIHIVAVVPQPARLHAWATVVIGEAPPAYKLVSRFGEKGSGPGRFIDPHAVAIGHDGNLIIVDSTPARVYRYTRQGRYLGEVGLGPGSGPGQFDGPRDVQVDPAGNIFIADVDNSRIMVFSDAGKFLFQWGKDGRGPGEFHAPHGLGGDANGDLFVSNYHGPCQKFTGDGRFLFDFAPVSRTGGPTHWHAMTSDRWGDAYLMARDKDNRSSIMKYNNQGTFVTSWPPLRGVDEWGVKAATVDEDGAVYACVESRERVGVEVYREE